jgi:hypothetical protein
MISREKEAAQSLTSLLGKTVYGNPDKTNLATHSYFNLHGVPFDNGLAGYLRGNFSVNTLGITVRQDNMGITVPNDKLAAFVKHVGNYDPNFNKQKTQDPAQQPKVWTATVTPQKLVPVTVQPVQTISTPGQRLGGFALGLEFEIRHKKKYNEEDQKNVLAKFAKAEKKDPKDAFAGQAVRRIDVDQEGSVVVAFSKKKYAERAQALVVENSSFKEKELPITKNDPGYAVRLTNDLTRNRHAFDDLSPALMKKQGSKKDDDDKFASVKDVKQCKGGFEFNARLALRNVNVGRGGV